MNKSERLSLSQVRPVGDKIIDQTGEEFDTQSYSRFKYGSGEVAAHYGFGLADLISEKHAELLDNGAELVITSSAFKHVPTASYAVAVNLHAAINHRLAEQGQQASGNIKIHRHTLLEGDYGTLSQQEREAKMRANKLYVDRESIEGKHVLVVDDIKITGAHERRVEEAVKDLDLLSLWFLYAVEMDADAAEKDPTIENRMNHAFVHDLNSLADVIATKSFLLNARTCKYILSWNDEHELRGFFHDMDSDFLHTLYTGSIGDGYGFMESYKPALSLLKEELRQRDLLVQGRLQPPPSDLGQSRYTNLLDIHNMQQAVHDYEKTSKESQEDNETPYRESVAADALREAAVQGKDPAITFFNPDEYLSDQPNRDHKGARKIRVAAEADGGVFAIMTAKPAEMVISERTRLNSPHFHRPVPHFGSESDTRKRMYIDPALAIPKGIMDAPILVTAGGTQIYVLKEENGEKFYVEDTAYREQMAASSAHWRRMVTDVLQMIDPLQELGRLSIVEDPENYRRGKTRYAPPDFRVLFHITTPIEDPEMDKKDLIRQKNKVNKQKKHALLTKLERFKRLYPRYQALYQTFTEYADDEEAEYELFQIEQALKYAGIKPNPHAVVSNADLHNIHAIDDSSPENGIYSLQFVPRFASEARALDWIMDNVTRELPPSKDQSVHVRTIVDHFPDLSMGLWGAGREKHGWKVQNDLILPTQSRLTKPLMDAYKRRNEKKTKRTFIYSEFAGEDLRPIARRLTVDSQTGTGTFKPPLTRDANVTIGDIAFPGTSASESIVRALETTSRD